jgi:hypothetical protein
MFRRGGCLQLLLIGLLFLAFLGAGRSAAYQAGWSQGYYAAQQADGEAAPPAAPYTPYAPGGWHHGPGFGPRPFLCGLGLLLPLGLFFLFFATIGRLFRHHRHGPKHFAGWHGHKHFGGWHGHHGPEKYKGNWSADEDEPLDPTIRKA